MSVNRRYRLAVDLPKGLRLVIVESGQVNPPGPYWAGVDVAGGPAGTGIQSYCASPETAVKTLRELCRAVLAALEEVEP